MGDAARSDTYNQVLKPSSLREMFQPDLKIASGGPSSPNGPDDHDSVGLSCFIRVDGNRRFIGHGGNQNGFISHFYIQSETRNAYVVSFNTDASDPQQNTAQFDRDLRDYLFANFFSSEASPPAASSR